MSQNLENQRLSIEENARNYDILNTKYISICDSAEKWRTQLSIKEDELKTAISLRGELSAKLADSQNEVERLETDLELARRACSEYKSKIKSLEEETQNIKRDSDSKVMIKIRIRIR